MKQHQYHNPLPRDAASSIQKAIDKIHFAKIEHLYFFKGGKQIRRFSGEANRVTPDPLYLFEMNDAIVVHNHPRGGSFSVGDVVGLIKYNAEECILVSQGFIYYLKRPNAGWGINCDSNDFDSVLNACKELADDALNKMITRNEMTIHEKEVEIFHYIWIFFFGMTNAKYERRKIKTF